MRKLSISTIIHSLTSSLHLPCLTRSLPSPLCFSYLRSCTQLKSSTCQFSHFPLQVCSELVCWPFFPPSLCYHPLHNYPHTAKQLLWLQKYLQIYNNKKTGNDTNNFTITSFPTHHSKIVKNKSCFTTPTTICVKFLTDIWPHHPTWMQPLLPSPTTFFSMHSL